MEESSSNKMITLNPKIRYTFRPLILPKDQWCDFRMDFETGMTLKQIAEKYCCDARTVRSCIQKNKPSSSLGKKSTDPILQPYRELIDTYMKQNSMHDDSIYQYSRELTEYLTVHGYTGSERTVRNELKTRLFASMHIVKEED